MALHINIWYTPRSRSTALLRCLSNIENSKVFHENFVWAFLHGETDSRTSENPENFAHLQFSKLTPKGFNYTNTLAEYINESSKIKISKDSLMAVKKEDYHKIMTKDSVNIILTREPVRCFTSGVPGRDCIFYDVIKPDSNKAVFSFQEFYSAHLDVIEYVYEHCTQPAYLLKGGFFIFHHNIVLIFQPI